MRNTCIASSLNMKLEVFIKRKIHVSKEVHKHKFLNPIKYIKYVSHQTYTCYDIRFKTITKILRFVTAILHIFWRSQSNRKPGNKYFTNWCLKPKFIHYYKKDKFLTHSMFSGYCI